MSDAHYLLQFICYSLESKTVMPCMILCQCLHIHEETSLSPPFLQQLINFHYVELKIPHLFLGGLNRYSKQIFGQEIVHDGDILFLFLVDLAKHNAQPLLVLLCFDLAFSILLFLVSHPNDLRWIYRDSSDQEGSCPDLISIAFTSYHSLVRQPLFYLP